MFDIVIIGYGKAGQLHHKVFCELLQDNSKICYHDPYLKIGNRDIHNKSRDLESIEWNEKTVLDICTNSDRHLEWIEFAVRTNIKYVIVEKPLVTTKFEMNKLLELSIQERACFTTNYNYLSSPVLSELKKILLNYQLTILSIKTNFSKNRVSDSRLRRGADRNGGALHNFFVEIPHQLSIAAGLLGQVKEIVLCYSGDMVLTDQSFKNHGLGFIKVAHINGTSSEHYSNLANEETIREIIIEADNNSFLKGYFGQAPHYQGSVGLFKNGVCLFTKAVEDKSLDSFLAEALSFFKRETANPCDFDFATGINQVIVDSVELSEEKKAS